MLAILGTAVCILIPASNLLTWGSIRWAVSQAAYWQGGLEMLALIGLAGGALAFWQRPGRWLLVAVPIAIYLRRHAVDVAVLLDVAYLEIVIGLGALARRAFRLSPPRDIRGYLRAFVAGFVAWSLLAWSASALRMGSMQALSLLTLALAVPAAFGGHRPLLAYLWQRACVQTRDDRFWCGAMLAWIATLFARTKVVQGYDSLWYGLRSEYVLAPGHSVFEPLGLVSPVYYFPKLYEVFLLPLARFHDHSSLDGMTILCLGLALLACLQLARRIGLPERARMATIALVATLPAFANSALSPKPDVISVLFILVAADAAMSFLQSRNARHFAWLVAGCVLACMVKLSAIPYAAALGFATLVGGWHAHWRDRIGAQAPEPMPVTRSSARGVGENALAAFVALASLVVAALVTARTWSLTGMPTIGPDPLFRLWGALGMNLTPPAGTLRWSYPQVWSDIPALVIDWLFRPRRLLHIVITWVGNVWVWCAALAAAASWCGARVVGNRSGGQWPLIALMLTGAVLALAIRYHVRGSDGNYFLFALLPAILESSRALFSRLAATPRVFTIALACLPAFVGFQAAYSFASAGWTPGTRAIDVRFDRPWKETRGVSDRVLRQAGLAGIATYLRELPGHPRAVGYVADVAGFWLPARYEGLVEIGYSHPEYLDDADRLRTFLANQRIDFVILPNRYAPEPLADLPAGTLAAVDEYLGNPLVTRIDDRGYFMLDLSALHRSAQSDHRARPP